MAPDSRPSPPLPESPPPSERKTVVAPTEVASREYGAIEPLGPGILGNNLPPPEGVTSEPAFRTELAGEFVDAAAPSHEEHHANEKARHTEIAAARANHIANKPRPAKRPRR
jgi:hypothetical protein